MKNRISSQLCALATLLTIGSASSLAQFKGRAGPPPRPAPIRVGTPPAIMSAPVARQSALPLVAPPVSPILGRRLPIWSTFGGFSYVPNYPTGFSQPNVIINYNYTFPEPYIPPRNLVVLPPVPNVHPNTALLSLKVPGGAVVYLDGKTVDVETTEHTFESPDLNPGDTYSFDVRVTWTENGKPVEEKRVFTVKAGGHQSMQYKALSPVR